MEIETPAQPAHSGWAFHEFARRHGDYALVGVAATVQMDSSARCTGARLVYLSVGEGPTPAEQAVALLLGQTPSAELIAEAAHTASEHIEPLGDIHATAAYRRRLVEVLGRRALADAFTRAGAAI